MGISKSAYRLLIEDRMKHNLQGKLLQLGRQHTFVTLEELRDIAIEKKIHSEADAKILYEKLQKTHKGEYVNDIELFTMLDFKTIHSMDVSDHEAATYIHDLNLPAPQELQGQYDVIFDGGTVEHVFNIHQSLKNIHQLLKPGGVIIHASPSHNHVDHGYYMFSPLLFCDYYQINGYKILTSYVLEYSNELGQATWEVYNYTPGCLQHLSFGGFGKKMLGIWFVAQKQSNSLDVKFPQQGDSIVKSANDLVFKDQSASKWRKILKKSKSLRNLGKRVKRVLAQSKARKHYLKKIGTF